MLHNTLKNARESLKEQVIEYFDDSMEISDTIFEITDSHVPVYTYDLLKCALDNLGLATEEPELGPAFDGSPTPVNIIAANIFETIEADLWEYWHDELEPMIDDHLERLDEIEGMEEEELDKELIAAGETKEECEELTEDEKRETLIEWENDNFTS